jgi:hypothetical protein
MHACDALHPLNVGEDGTLILGAVFVAACGSNELGECIDDDQTDVCAEDRLGGPDCVDNLLEGLGMRQIYCLA